jgi:hypothetical protein
MLLICSKVNISCRSILMCCTGLMLYSKKIDEPRIHVSIDARLSCLLDSILETEMVA